MAPVDNLLGKGAVTGFVLRSAGELSTYNTDLCDRVMLVLRDPQSLEIKMVTYFVSGFGLSDGRPDEPSE